MTTSSTMTDSPAPPLELQGGNKTRAVIFSANGEYLVSGDEKKVRVWRVEDGKQVTAMQAGLVNCLAVSNDCRFIAAGTFSGEMIVWDTFRAYKRVFALEDHYVVGLDFSPDSTQLLTASFNCTATVWDVANRERALTFRRVGDEEIVAAKYSPQGDRIVIATGRAIRVYSSNGGRLLVDIRAEVTPWYNTGLRWSNDQLFIVSESKIKQIDASTGSTVSEWPVPDSDASTCIALQQHGDFIAYSANRTVTVWDTYDTHTQLDRIHHPQIIRSIAISQDDRFLAIGGERGKITIRRLPRSLTDLIPLSRLHPTFQEPDIQIHDAALEAWKHGQLANAEALLTAAIPTSLDVSHHILASRSLVKTRLGDWDAAIVDAKESIKTQRSVIGYIAKSVALVGKGEKYKAYRACDIAFERFHSNHVTFLLLTKAIVVFMSGEHDDAISRVDDLIATVRSNSICYVVQAQMYLLLGNSHMEHCNHEDAIRSFERALAKVRPHTSRPLSAVSLISGWKFDDIEITIRRRLCEATFAAGSKNDAGKLFLKLVSTINEEAYISCLIINWICDFAQRYLATPEDDDDATSNANPQDDSPTSDTTPASSIHMPILRQWTKAKLTCNEWQAALVASANFFIPKPYIYRAICEHLAATDRLLDATECFRQLVSEVIIETQMQDEEAKWVADFKLRCIENLEHLGDTAMDAHSYKEAITQYSAAMSLNPEVRQSLFIKRSKSYIAAGLWKQALNDAEELIKLDPSSPWGYERKHAALHKAGSYADAIQTFETMLLKMSQFSDPEIRACCSQYVTPEEAKKAIRDAVRNAIRDSPRVLIHTDSGRLLDKTKQALSFESLPVFEELISSMTTNVSHARIQQEVTEYYRYATLSHTWEDNEPLFEKVAHVVVYDLEIYPTHDKLQMFCNIVRDAGFHWAWSDTCCINKGDHVVLQEALVAMFKWYEGSSMTVIFLRGVRSPSRRGDLVRSVWNTRAWTFQEYHASKVVRFYTEDWAPYLNLDIHNHKDSPEIIMEMEEVTGISARALVALRPGLDDIREKLCLASTRETRFVEDEAYSLLGIFSMTLPVMYGEGNQSLGRLLAGLLTSSGDTSILAWTGSSGSFNSCLPAKISVFKQLPITHVPQAIQGAEMDRITAALRTSSLSLNSAMKLYDKLHELPVPWFSGQRMKLPCLTFALGSVVAAPATSGSVFYARTDILDIEITTTEDLSRLDSLVVVHPWIDFLLERRPIGAIADLILADVAHAPSFIVHTPSLVTGSSSSSASSNGPPSPTQRRASMMERIRRSFSGQSRDIPLTDKRTQALQLVARLRQPFGALLLKQNRHNVAEYKRVAAESKISVRIKEDTPLEMLIDSVRLLDVL